MREDNSYIINQPRTFSIMPVLSSSLSPGDIAFKHPEAFRGPIIIDHCLLCTGYDNETDTYEFIEAHFHHGVQYRFEKSENISHASWGPYVRVFSASNEQKRNAIDFARKQIGRAFQKEWINKNYNPTDNENDSFADEWYCSELIWAAYYNCNFQFPENLTDSQCFYGDGIDLDMNGWMKVLNISVVAPREILFDDDVRRIFLFDFDWTNDCFYKRRSISISSMISLFQRKNR